MSKKISTATLKVELVIMFVSTVQKNSIPTVKAELVIMFLSTFQERSACKPTGCVIA